MDLSINLKNISFEVNDKKFRLFNLSLFIISISLYFINSTFFKSQNLFFNFYFADLLASIVLFSFLNTLYPVKLTNSYLLLITTAIASFIWEYVALFIKSGAVFDLKDILCYFLSCFIYILLVKFYKYFSNNNFNH